MPLYAENRKARHEYEILEKYEGGLELLGSEVKAIREGGCKLEGSYVRLMRGELYLVGAQIRAYSKIFKRDEYDPTRSRKVLVNARELRSIAPKLAQKGLTLVPLSLYPLGRRVKLAFALCRGKKAHDKRETLKERELSRRLRRNDDE
jgi:SsrA-binding protein